MTCMRNVTCWQQQSKSLSLPQASSNWCVRGRACVRAWARVSVCLSPLSTSLDLSLCAFNRSLFDKSIPAAFSHATDTPSPVELCDCLLLLQARSRFQQADAQRGRGLKDQPEQASANNAFQTAKRVQEQALAKVCLCVCMCSVRAVCVCSVQCVCAVCSVQCVCV